MWREKVGEYLIDLFDSAGDFWRANIWVLVLFIIALLADGISTIYFMLHEGVDTELHPVVNFVSRIAGPVVGPLIAVSCKAIAGFIVAFYWRRIAVFILLTVSIISFWAAWYNTWGWQVYEANILHWWPF
jgi:hypothetical protein